ncbi:hypothetical protein LTR84_008559 [Exophiala bonariae]|uniref:Xylanolytic transcriptional activator regulatory domain-containing protein n=1 Tax=Exophiala bonariae TaxID=1690606 RepID=A0AAV9MZD7_9EURO|nr:hypothetical protein LTR84_008559 [Exophiala bonariae]
MDKFKILEDKIKRLENERPFPDALDDSTSSENKHIDEGEQTSPTNDVSTYAIIGAAESDSSMGTFFGSSSAGTFMRTVQKIVKQKLEGDLWSSASAFNATHDTCPRLIPDFETTKQSLDYVLPPRHEADSLMTLYWNHMHPFSPFLDKEQFQADYDDLWRARDSHALAESFMCLLHIILALSSQIDISVPLDSRAALATKYYEKARRLMHILEVGSIRSVQSYLLLGQYFLSTQQSHHTWLYVGLAIRTAQSLGLHLPGTSELVCDSRTRELLRRVWHGCILIDRISSTAYGRPCMIGAWAADGVPRPEAFGSEWVPSSLNSKYNLKTSKRPSLVDFSTCFLDLAEILHDVILHFHYGNKQQNQAAVTGGTSITSTAFSAYVPILDLEGRLQRWEESIPPHLCVGSRPGKLGIEAMLYRQAVVLQQWSLYVRILLFRPILSELIINDLRKENYSKFFKSRLTYSINVQCSIDCVRAAQRSIDLLYSEKAVLGGEIGFVAPWWYNILFLYKSATILIAARLSPSILADVAEDSIAATWSRAVELISNYGRYSKSIQRLLTTLLVLADAVASQYSKNFQRPQSYDNMLYPLPAEALSHNMEFSTEEQFMSATYFPQVDPPDPWISRASNGRGDGENPIPTAADFNAAFDPNDLSWLNIVFQ